MVDLHEITFEIIPRSSLISSQEWYALVASALLEATLLPDDIVREIVSHVRIRDCFDDVMNDLEDYWLDKFLEDSTEEEDSGESSSDD